ncbi:MAG: ester cyclase [Chloroflexi bacterium]|nr:ester cyclase [Chloroflexota bacterium]
MHESFVYKFNEVLNRHDVGAIADCYAPYAVMFSGDYREPARGREAIVYNWAAMFRAFPDINAKLLRTYESGDWVVAEYSWTGTNTGFLEAPWGTVSPTGKRVTMEGVCVCRRNSEGLIVEEKGYFDSLSLFSQLGLLHQVPELAKVTPLARAA